MPRGQVRKRLGPGRYIEGDSKVAEVRIGSSRDGTIHRERKRFPLSTDDSVLISWQLHTKGALIDARPKAASRGTLAADIPVYLGKLAEGGYKRDSIGIFKAWAASPLAEKSRHAITRDDVLSQITAWENASVAASTINRRLSRLRKLYHRFDGIEARNPTDRITFLRQPEAEARAIPVRIVQKILELLDDRGRAAKGEARPALGLTKIRLRVGAWTGAAPETIKKIRARDLDLRNARAYLQPREKGKGSPGAWVSLLPDAVEALRDFVAAGLIGTKGARSSMGKTWRVGLARARKFAEREAEAGDGSWLADMETLPAHPKPYDLRHSFATTVYETTGDIRAVAALLQHASLDTTKRYTAGAVSATVQRAIATAAKAYEAAPAKPSTAKATSPRLVRSA